MREVLGCSCELRVQAVGPVRRRRPDLSARGDKHPAPRLKTRQKGDAASGHAGTRLSARGDKHPASRLKTPKEETSQAKA